MSNKQTINFCLEATDTSGKGYLRLIINGVAVASFWTQGRSSPSNPRLFSEEEKDMVAGSAKDRYAHLTADTGDDYDALFKSIMDAIAMVKRRTAKIGADSDELADDYLIAAQSTNINLTSAVAYVYAAQVVLVESGLNTIVKGANGRQYTYCFSTDASIQTLCRRAVFNYDWLRQETGKFKNWTKANLEVFSKSLEVKSQPFGIVHDDEIRLTPSQTGGHPVTMPAYIIAPEFKALPHFIGGDMLYLRTIAQLLVEYLDRPDTETFVVTRVNDKTLEGISVVSHRGKAVVIVTKNRIVVVGDTEEVPDFFVVDVNTHSSNVLPRVIKQLTTAAAECFCQLSFKIKGTYWPKVELGRALKVFIGEAYPEYVEQALSVPWQQSPVAAIEEKESNMLKNYTATLSPLGFDANAPASNVIVLADFTKHEVETASSAVLYDAVTYLPYTVSDDFVNFINDELAESWENESALLADFSRAICFAVSELKIEPTLVIAMNLLHKATEEPSVVLCSKDYFIQQTSTAFHLFSSEFKPEAIVEITPAAAKALAGLTPVLQMVKFVEFSGLGTKLQKPTRLFLCELLKAFVEELELHTKTDGATPAAATSKSPKAIWHSFDVSSPISKDKEETMEENKLRLRATIDETNQFFLTLDSRPLVKLYLQPLRDFINTFTISGVNEGGQKFLSEFNKRLDACDKHFMSLDRTAQVDAVVQIFADTLATQVIAKFGHFTICTGRFEDREMFGKIYVYDNWTKTFTLTQAEVTLSLNPKHELSVPLTGFNFPEPAASEMNHFRLPRPLMKLYKTAVNFFEYGVKTYGDPNYDLGTAKIAADTFFATESQPKPDSATEAPQHTVINAPPQGLYDAPVIKKQESAMEQKQKVRLSASFYSETEIMVSLNLIPVTTLTVRSIRPGDLPALTRSSDAGFNFESLLNKRLAEFVKTGQVDQVGGPLLVESIVDLFRDTLNELWSGKYGNFVICAENNVATPSHHKVYLCDNWVKTLSLTPTEMRIVQPNGHFTSFAFKEPLLLNERGLTMEGINRLNLSPKLSVLYMAAIAVYNHAVSNYGAPGYDEDTAKRIYDRAVTVYTGVKPAATWKPSEAPIEAPGMKTDETKPTPPLTAEFMDHPFPSATARSVIRILKDGQPIIHLYLRPLRGHGLSVRHESFPKAFNAALAELDHSSISLAVLTEAVVLLFVSELAAHSPSKGGYFALCIGNPQLTDQRRRVYVFDNWTKVLSVSAGEIAIVLSTGAVARFNKQVHGLFSTPTTGRVDFFNMDFSLLELYVAADVLYSHCVENFGLPCYDDETVEEIISSFFEKYSQPKPKAAPETLAQQAAGTVAFNTYSLKRKENRIRLKIKVNGEHRETLDLYPGQPFMDSFFDTLQSHHKDGKLPSMRHFSDNVDPSATVRAILKLVTETHKQGGETPLYAVFTPASPQSPVAAAYKGGVKVAAVWGRDAFLLKPNAFECGEASTGGLQYLTIPSRLTAKENGKYSAKETLALAIELTDRRDRFLETFAEQFTLNVIETRWCKLV